MRLSTRLAIGLILVGAVAILVSSGAFDAVTADRFTDLDTAAQEPDALLGVEYPQTQTITLQPADARSCTSFFGCVHADETLMDLIDNTEGQSLDSAEITQTSVQGSPDVIYDSLFGQGVRVDDSLADGSATVLADFSCPAQGGFFSAEQEPADVNVTVTFEATSGNLTIEPTREFRVICIEE